jgi:preprotein translocase subunit SecE
VARSRQSRTRRKREGFQQERARQRRQQIKPVGEPKSQTGQKRERRGGFRAFAGESYAELKKVDWPGRQQLMSATLVVIIAVAVVGTYLFAADWVVQRFVRDVLLNL